MSDLKPNGPSYFWEFWYWSSSVQKSRDQRRFSKWLQICTNVPVNEFPFKTIGILRFKIFFSNPYVDCTTRERYTLNFFFRILRKFTETEDVQVLLLICPCSIILFLTEYDQSRFSRESFSFQLLIYWFFFKKRFFKIGL